MKLNSQEGTQTPDNLFADNNVDIQVKAVTLKAGQGVLPRGSVLGVITASGLAVSVDSSKSDGSQIANTILADAVDTGAPEATDDVVAQAYISGRFNREALTFGGTDDAADHELRLRELGIFLADNISY